MTGAPLSAVTARAAATNASDPVHRLTLALVQMGYRDNRYLMASGQLCQWGQQRANVRAARDWLRYDMLGSGYAGSNEGQAVRVGAVQPGTDPVRRAGAGAADAGCVAASQLGRQLQLQPGGSCGEHNYDFLTAGRPTVFVNIGPEQARLGNLSRRETDERIARMLGPVDRHSQVSS